MSTTGASWFALNAGDYSMWVNHKPRRVCPGNPSKLAWRSSRIWRTPGCGADTWGGGDWNLSATRATLCHARSRIRPAAVHGRFAVRGKQAAELVSRCVVGCTGVECGVLPDIHSAAIGLVRRTFVTKDPWPAMTLATLNSGVDFALRASASVRIHRACANG